MINDILNKYLNNEKSSAFSSYTPDSIAALLRHLNNPQNNFKSLHIAGTNGKGSTAHMLSKILQESGYKTGLYTSPHLIKINERIKINSNDIDDTVLHKYISHIDSIVKNDTSLSPTYFDILTAAALKYFSDKSVDVAIIETGLGGRLDSTNVIVPEISIITDISMDHMHVLGNSIYDIASEKCGIIKPNVPVITSNTNHIIVDLIKINCKKNNSELYLFDDNFFTKNITRNNGYFVFDFISNNYNLLNVKLPLFPIHQVKNAALVISALSYLKSSVFKGISDKIICRELEKIEVPARFQKLNMHPLIIFDPAHNFDALNNLVKGLNTFYPEKKKLFIISMMKDKAEFRTLELLSTLDAIYYVLNDERSYVAENDKFNIITSDDNIVIDIMKKINENGGMIIFTGTFRIYNNAVNLVKKFNK